MEALAPGQIRFAFVTGARPILQGTAMFADMNGFSHYLEPVGERGGV